MYIFLVILYIILGIFMLWRLIKNNKQNKTLGSYSGIVFGMTLYYSIIPIMTMLNINQLSSRFVMVENYIANKEWTRFMYVFFLIVISFISLELGYKLKIKKKQDIQEKSEIQKYNDEKKVTILKVITWILFVIGAICIIIFFIGFGGVGKALEYGNTGRSFASSPTDIIPYWISLLIIPARLITVCTFLFLWLDSIEHEKKYIYKVLAVVSFILSILFFLYNAGKTPLICFILSFIVAWAYKYTKKVWTYIIPIAIIALPLLDVIDEVFAFLQKGVWNNINIDYLRYLNNFIYPFRNMLNLPEIIGQFGLSWGRDFITSILNFIPGVQFPISYENISMFYAGENWRAVGGVPSDLITFLYTQFGAIGLPFLFAILGFLLRKIDNALMHLSNKYAIRLIKVIICIQTFTIIASADFEALLRGQFILIILSILVLLTDINKKYKEKKEK